jgi:hypothetical protein
LALSENINSLEKDKFAANDAGLTAVRVLLTGGMAPDAYDEIQATYPTSASEVYTYKLNTTTVATVTVTYTDSTKEVLTSVVRT